MTEIYRSETRRLRVEITFRDGTVLAGDVHLQPNTMLAEGFETLVDMLNRPERFFALALESNQVVLLAKTQVAVVTCAREGGDSDPDDYPGTIAQLDIWLASGGRFRGTAMWQLPPAHSRPLDFVNTTGGFLELIDDEYARYINVNNIRAVYPG